MFVFKTWRLSGLLDVAIANVAITGPTVFIGQISFTKNPLWQLEEKRFKQKDARQFSKAPNSKLNRPNTGTKCFQYVAHCRNTYLSYLTSNLTGCLLNIRTRDRFFLSILTLKTSLYSERNQTSNMYRSSLRPELNWNKTKASSW